MSVLFEMLPVTRAPETGARAQHSEVSKSTLRIKVGTLGLQKAVCLKSCNLRRL